MTNNLSQPKSWRDMLPIHPAAELFPRMCENELRKLGEDIKARGGLIQAVHLYKGKLLDGRNRLDAMELVGFTFDNAELNGLAHHLDDSVDPYNYVIAANLHRRHLTSEQKRELIAKVLKAKPAASNRQIAKKVKADDKTVAGVRRDLESTAEIPHLKKTVGADGKSRKTRKSTKPQPSNARKPEPKLKRPTAFDVLAVWLELPPAEDRRVFEGIGLRRILEGIPETWQAQLEKWLEERRRVPA